MATPPKNSASPVESHRSGPIDRVRRTRSGQFEDIFEDSASDLYEAAFFLKPYAGDGDKEQPEDLDVDIADTTQEVVEQFIDPKYRDTVRNSLREFMTDQGYFGNQFIQNLLRGENKMPCIAWWSLIQKQAPTMQLRAFASAVVMIQSFPCSAASVERVNSTLGHSMPLECSPKCTRKPREIDVNA